MRFAVALLLALCWRPALADLDLAGVSGRRVAAVEMDNGSRVRDAEIRDLLGLRTGQRYEAQAIARGLARLAQKLGIRNVVLRGRAEGDSVVVRIEVTPEPLIWSLGFQGNHVVRDKDLVTLISTRVDQPVRQTTLDRDALAIQERYAQEGFPEAHAVARVSERNDPHWVDLVFQVDEGPAREIKGVEGSAEPAMDQARMLALLALNRGSPASQTKLRTGVPRLLEVLRREGYPEARMGKASYRPEDGGAVLVLPLELGQRLDVRLEGVDEWPGGPLRELVRSRYGEPLDEDWAQKTAALMEEELQSQGYREARVVPEFGAAYGNRRLVFHVTRGPQVHVEEVRFSGNDHVDAEQLLSYMSLVEGGLWGPPPFTQEALERDLRVLGEFYASQGYLDARVSVEALTVAPNGDAVLRLRVEEGRRFRVGEVSFVGNGALSAGEAAAAADLKPGAPADPGALEGARVRLLRELEGRGYLDAVVDLETRRDDERAALDAVYRIHSGPLVRFGRVVVSGNARTQTRVIRRELTFRQGDPWDPEAVRRGRQALYRLGFFQRVRIEPLPTESGESVRDVLVEVVEQDAGSITLGLGYGTEEGVKGVVSVSHANLQGLGRSLGARYDFDRFDRSYAVNFREPWLFGRPYSLGLSLVKSYQQRAAYTLSSLSLQSSLERKFSDQLTASLLYTLEENTLTDVVDEEVVGAQNLSSYLLSSLGPVFAWDSRDDPFNPRRGFYHTLQAEWATDAFGSQVQFERYAGMLSGFFSTGKATLALLTRGGVAQRLGQAAELPVNKRFFLGGRSTIRGFRKDEVGPVAADGTPAGGDLMVNLKAELRYPLWGNLGGALFWDAGNVWNRSPGFPGSSGLRQGAGGSLRYITPVGPIALDLGFNLAPRAGEAPYVWYFNIGNVF